MESEDTDEQMAKLATLMRKGMSITVSKNSWMKSIDGFKRAAVIKMATGEYFNVNAVAGILKKAWTVEDKDITFEEISGNMVVAKFRKQTKLDEVLNGGPLTFQNQVICVKKWIIGTKPEKLDFDKLQVWVQLHNIPQEYMDDEVTREIAAGIGKIIKSPVDDIGVKKRKFARYMVEFDINNEIPEGALIKLSEGEVEPFWVNFKFERLQVLCTRCNVINHKTSNCPYDEENSANCLPEITTPENINPDSDTAARAAEMEEERERLLTDVLTFRKPNDAIDTDSDLKIGLSFEAPKTLRIENKEMEDEAWIANKKT